MLWLSPNLPTEQNRLPLKWPENMHRKVSVGGQNMPPQSLPWCCMAKKISMGEFNCNQLAMSRRALWMGFLPTPRGFSRTDTAELATSSKAAHSKSNGGDIFTSLQLLWRVAGQPASPRVATPIPHQHFSNWQGAPFCWPGLYTHIPQQPYW